MYSYTSTSVRAKLKKKYRQKLRKELRRKKKNKKYWCQLHLHRPLITLNKIWTSSHKKDPWKEHQNWGNTKFCTICLARMRPFAGQDRRTNNVTRVTAAKNKSNNLMHALKSPCQIKRLKPREVTQSYADFELPNGKIAQATEGYMLTRKLSLSIKWNTVWCCCCWHLLETSQFRIYFNLGGKGQKNPSN